MHFIAGDFLDECLPKDKQYLYRYFRTNLQKQFVRYMQVFDNSRFFAEHTGQVCQRRNRQLLGVKLRKVEEAHRNAKLNMDFDLLEKIEKGKLRVPRGS